MTNRQLTAAVNDVSATYDHAARLDYVDIELTFETTHTTNVGKRQVTYGAPRFRFSVDTSGVARLAEIESLGHERTQDEPRGVLVSDFRALPAAIDLLEGIGDIDRVESIDTSISGTIAEIDEIEFEAE